MVPNTMYPNIPEGFPEAVRKARVAKGISLRKAAKDLGFPAAAKLSQLELGRRNFSYENAVLVRDYLEMDFVLPPVDLTQKVRIFRNREKKTTFTRSVLHQRRWGSHQGNDILQDRPNHKRPSNFN